MMHMPNALNANSQNLCFYVMYVHYIYFPFVSYIEFLFLCEMILRVYVAHVNLERDMAAYYVATYAIIIYVCTYVDIRIIY